MSTYRRIPSRPTYKLVRRTPAQIRAMRIARNGRWSPVSNAGKIFEWNRGVIGISEDGEIYKECLDETTTHHAGATYKVANHFEITIIRTPQPYKAGVSCSSQGLLLLQFEGDKVCIYFPQSLSEEQFTSLEEIIAPRDTFIYSYDHEGDVVDDKTSEEIMQYAEGITEQKGISASR